MKNTIFWDVSKRSLIKIQLMFRMNMFRAAELDPKGGRNIFFETLREIIRDYTALHPRRQYSAYAPGLQITPAVRISAIQVEARSVSTMLTELSDYCSLPRQVTQSCLGFNFITTYIFVFFDYVDVGHFPNCTLLNTELTFSKGKR
jgi:hypothetical protein